MFLKPAHFATRSLGLRVNFGEHISEPRGSNSIHLGPSTPPACPMESGLPLKAEADRSLWEGRLMGRGPDTPDHYGGEHAAPTGIAEARLATVFPSPGRQLLEFRRTRNLVGVTEVYLELLVVFVFCVDSCWVC